MDSLPSSDISLDGTITAYKYRKFKHWLDWASRDLNQPGPYISLAADVCEIKSTISPKRGSMTHPEVSEWLGDMQKKRWEGAGSRCSTAYETKPQVNLGSPSTPLLEIRKQAVIDATASHTFISPNAFPGQILAHIRNGLHAWYVITNLGRLTDVQSQIRTVLDQAAFH